MTPEELARLDEVISPLIKKGQPLSHIFAVHADDIPVCRRLFTTILIKGFLKQEISICTDESVTKSAAPGMLL